MTWNFQKHSNKSNISKAVKEELLSSDVIHKIFEHFSVSLDRLDKLLIEIAPLEDKYAETNLQVMRLNENMFKDGWEDFKKNYFFVVAHEIIHWLSRVREEDSYFNDPEEVLGFVCSIAYEISKNTHKDEIWNKIFPKVSFHFSNQEDARSFFQSMFEKAEKFLSN